MRHFLFIHVLRAKYFTGSAYERTRYFWSLRPAIAEADGTGQRQTVWTRSWGKAYTAKGYGYTVHPDAHNFTPYQ
jgi:hypothetical protein